MDNIIEDLEAFVWRINELAGTPLHRWMREHGIEKTQVGNFHLDQLDGKFAFHQVETLGLRDVFNGYVEAEEMHTLLVGHIAGQVSQKKERGWR